MKKRKFDQAEFEKVATRNQPTPEENACRTDDEDRRAIMAMLARPQHNATMQGTVFLTGYDMMQK